MYQRMLPRPSGALEKSETASVEHNTTKRARVDWGDDNDDDWGEEEVGLLESLGGSGRLYEILTCVRRLRTKFQATCPHFVSRTLVYDALVGGGEADDDNEDDRDDEKAGGLGETPGDPHALSVTDVDISLEELKRKKVLMALYLPGVGDVALIETDEYREIVRRLKPRTPKRLNAPDSLRLAIEFFQEIIVGTHPGPTFQMPKGGGRGGGSGSTSTDHLDVLVKHDLLLRMPAGKNAPNVDVFAFKVPGSGQVVKSCVDGRLELVSRIKRKRHQEMLVSKIRKEIKLRKSTLGIDWHIADLKGSGLVRLVPTTVGSLLRLIAHE